MNEVTLDGRGLGAVDVGEVFALTLLPRAQRAEVAAQVPLTEVAQTPLLVRLTLAPRPSLPLRDLGDLGD